MKTRVQVPASISGFRTLADNTLRVTLDIGKEIPAEESAVIIALRNLHGWFLYQVNEFTDAEVQDLPDAPALDDLKTPSQRLRDRMFVYYKSAHGKSDGFNSWYADALEKIGQTYLERMEHA
jgi:hypothetical protein